MKIVNKRIAMVLAVSLMLYAVACSTFTSNAYKTLSITTTTVDTARQVYNNEFYNQGKVSPELDAKVAVAYKDYQKAMNVAISAVRTYQLMHDQGLPVTTDSVTLALANLSSAVTDLITLFNKAGQP